MPGPNKYCHLTPALESPECGLTNGFTLPSTHYSLLYNFKTLKFHINLFTRCIQSVMYWPCIHIWINMTRPTNDLTFYSEEVYSWVWQNVLPNRIGLWLFTRISFQDEHTLILQINQSVLQAVFHLGLNSQTPQLTNRGYIVLHFKVTGMCWDSWQSNFKVIRSLFAYIRKHNKEFVRL